MRVKARYVPVRYFFIALVPIFIFVQESVITDYFLATNLQVSPSILREDFPWLEASGRFRFLGATWFFGALAMLVFVLVIRDLIQPMRARTRVAAAAVLALIFTLAVLPTRAYFLDPDKPRIYSRLGGDLFETVLSHGSLPGCAQPDDRWLLGLCGEIPVISLFNRMMDLVNVFAGLGVGALIVGMILCLEKQPENDIEAQAAQLERDLNRMRRQLYLSGLVLTFGIFFATSWMRWPLPMVAEAGQDAFADLVAASSLFTGLYFSLLILSFYLPVALILDGRRRRLAQAATTDMTLTDPKARTEWQKARGLLSDPSEVFKSGFALAAPILAAFAGNVPIAV